MLGVGPYAAPSPFSQQGLSRNDNFVNTRTRTMGSIQAGRARTAKSEGETEMSKKQKLEKCVV